VRPAVPVGSGSCMLELQPARLSQRPILLNTQGQSDSDTPGTSLQWPSTLLQPASRPAGIDVQSCLYGPTDRPHRLRSPQQKCKPTCTLF